MSAMYTPANDHRPPGRSRHPRSQSDPEHSFVNVNPPYVVPWPVPGRTPTPYPHSPSHNSSAERIVDPFVPNSGFFLTRHPTSGPPNARAPPPTPVSPRSPSPRPGHQRNASRQGSIRVTQVSGTLIRDVHQPPRSVLNVASVVAAPRPHPVTWGQAPGSVVPGQSGMQRQGSHHAVHQDPSEAHLLHHSSTHRHHHHHHHHDHPSPSTTHHVVHHRTRPRTRPPTAASHRYATSITQPVYGHGSSTTSNTSRTSLNVNGGVASQRHPRIPSPPPASSISHNHRIGSTHVPSESPFYGSQPHTHAPSISGSIAPLHSVHNFDKMLMAADDIRRHTDRPPLPANYDGQMQTRYVNMLLALDGISPIFNVLSAISTWILLAGFVLLPSTFASLRNEPAGSAQSFILTVINHVSLFAIALACTGVGVCGMIWLWWRWHGNYIWITNRIFVPGCLNSMAGLISTLANIYGVQGGEFGRTEESAVIVTSSLSVICGTLFVVYEYWFIRNLKLEHDQEVGVELAGKHGAGVLEEKRDDQDMGA